MGENDTHQVLGTFGGRGEGSQALGRPERPLCAGDI